MQEIVADATSIRFDIEDALDTQLGAQPLPFPGMDKAGSAVCTEALAGICIMGTSCPFRHLKGDRTVVCKHWLRGLCKKGDDCEFLHEFDLSKMPECFFYSKYGACGNKECPFLHIDPESKVKACAWYDRGFCRHGPHCKNRHVRRVMCQNYQCGLCLHGLECKYMHPKFELPVWSDMSQLSRKMICHICNELDHKAADCPRLAAAKVTIAKNTSEDDASEKIEKPPTQQFRRRPLNEVTCYKCGEKGHYANKCPKGHLAFLSNSLVAPTPT